MIPWWIRVVPFFMSALFFLSAFFAVFAPLPLLFTHFRLGRGWGWLAILTNSIIVFVAAGPASLAIYAVFVLSLALIVPELLRLGVRLERTAAVSLLTIVLAGGVTLLAYAKTQHLNPLVEMKSQVSELVESFSRSLPPETMNEVDQEDWKRQVITEFPSVLGVFSLILVWANLVILLRANPRRIRERIGLAPGFVRTWRAPEVFLWFAIASGAVLVADLYTPTGSIGLIAANLFKFLMAVYAIQGLSVLSYFFEAWNIRGIFRTFAMLVAVFVMLPLLLSIGFFDQLFDFRAKFRQS